MRTVLLIANHPNDKLESMDRYVHWLERELAARSIDVSVLRPEQSLRWFATRNSFLGKWLAYFDKFFRFPVYLWWRTRSLGGNNTLYHVCDQADSVYLFALRRARHVITCHDMVSIRAALGEVAGFRMRFTGRVYQYIILAGLRRANQVVCVSKATLSDFERIAGVAARKVEVIWNPLNYNYRLLESAQTDVALDTVFKRVGLRRPGEYLFHVGGNQWYKNRLGLVRLFSAVAAQNPALTLVLAGQPLSGELVDLIRTLNLAGRILYVGRVANEELNALYSGAEALVFPSLMEGFGWPVLEAIASGCPVAASDIPVFREIANGAVHFLDLSRFEAAAVGLQAWLRELRDPAFRKGWIEDGVKMANRHTSSEVIEKYLECYKKL